MVPRMPHTFSPSQNFGAFGAFSSINGDGLFSHWTHSLEHEGEVDGALVGLDVGSSVGLGVGSFDGIALYMEVQKVHVQNDGKNKLTKMLDKICRVIIMDEI